VQQGQSLTVSGSGFRVGEAVAVTIAPETAATPGAPTTLVVDAGEPLVETVVADSAGSFALVSTIAADAPDGVRTVTADGAGSGLTASASYRVGAEAVVPAPVDPGAPGAPAPGVPGTGTGAGGAVPVVPAASGATPVATGSGSGAGASDLAFTGPGIATGVLLAMALALLGLGAAALVARRRVGASMIASTDDDVEDLVRG
jgi:hypothetical protein